MFVPSDTATLHGSLERDFRPLESAVYFLSEYFVFFLSFCLILSFSFHLSELNNNQHEFSAYHLHVIVPTKPEEKGERKKPVPSTLEENSTHAIKKKNKTNKIPSAWSAREIRTLVPTCGTRAYTRPTAKSNGKHLRKKKTICAVSVQTHTTDPNVCGVSPLLMP